MNEIMAGLLNIEQNIIRVEAAAEDEKADLPRRIEEARQKTYEKINKKNDERILKMQTSMQSENEKKIAEINSRTQKRLLYIEEQFEENGKHWENEIYNMILGN